MQQPNIKLIAVGETSTVPPSTAPPSTDICKELKDSLDKAHSIADKGAILAVQIVGELSEIVIASKYCISINPFSFFNCTTHKIEDGFNIYKKYKSQIIEQETKLNAALREVLSEFVACFQRVHS